MKSTKKAFTLVELIVVITILAILGTIAFISLQGYSSDARNTKRTSDLGNISSAITTKGAQGVPLSSFVTPVPGNKLAAVNIAGTGMTDTEITNDYTAGNPNYTALGVKEADFKDPTDKPYVLAVTNKIGGKYEMAATMEDGAGSYIAKVIGTYNPRSDNNFSSGDNVSSVDPTNNLVVILDNVSGFFKRGDTITDDGGITSTTITKISNDGLTLTVADASNLAVDSELELVITENAGLIDATSTVTAVIVTDGATATTNLPY